MKDYTEYLGEDTSICKDCFFELTNDNEAGPTRLDSDSEFIAIRMPSLERFAKMLVNRNEFDLVIPPTYKENTRRIIKTDQGWRTEWLKLLPRYLFLYTEMPRECRYSVSVETFFDVCEEFKDRLSYDHIKFFWEKLYMLYLDPNFDELKDAINDFVKEYRKRLMTSAIKKAIRDERKAANDRYRDFSRFVRDLFAVYSRLIIIRIDLGYKKEVNASIADLDKDIDHFFQNMRHNKFFRGLRGRIVKFEYGMAKGDHAHLILFIDGSLRNNSSDIYFGKKIGEYWVDVIAVGRGAYWNSNAEKQKYAEIGRLGIGVIEAHDENKIKNLLGIVKYLCKKEQFLKPRSNPKMKLLRKSQVPQNNGKKRGAPRKIRVPETLSSVSERM